MGSVAVAGGSVGGSVNGCALVSPYLDFWGGSRAGGVLSYSVGRARNLHSSTVLFHREQQSEKKERVERHTWEEEFGSNG